MRWCVVRITSYAEKKGKRDGKKGKNKMKLSELLSTKNVKPAEGIHMYEYNRRLKRQKQKTKIKNEK